MKFEKFEAHFVAQNLKLRYLLGATLLLLALSIGLQISDKKYFVLKNSELVQTRPLLTWVCEKAFMSISKGSPYRDLIDDSILVELKKNEFKVNAQEVLSVLALSEKTCRIIVKGEGEVRSFVVNFRSHNDYPFFFKLSEINEAELSQSELTLTKEVL